MAFTFTINTLKNVLNNNSNIQIKESEGKLAISSGLLMKIAENVECLANFVLKHFLLFLLLKFYLRGYFIPIAFHLRIFRYE